MGVSHGSGVPDPNGVRASPDADSVHGPDVNPGQAKVEAK